MSTTDGWLRLNFSSCVIRQTRSLGALVLCSICNMVFVNYIYDMMVDTQFHKFHGRPFARVLYVFLMKDIIGRWLPWVLPGSTWRFYKNDVVHNHYCYVLKRIKENWAKNVIHVMHTRIESGYISYERQFEWLDEQNRCTYDNVKITGACVVLPVNAAAGHSRGPAQACGSG